ncbi:MAG: hypothetical protein HXS44_08070 [Theionarchaea archaeon]|nr:hypothetical protein [Theionarchaea archaeon]
MWRFTDLEYHTCLILGEVSTGKTSLTQVYLDEAIIMQRSVAVIDMAPERKKGVGGKLVCKSSAETCNYYTAAIVTPRLSGKTEKEIVDLAELNRGRIDDIFNKYEPRDVLFINDVSIYLQRGNVEQIVSLISLSQTCIMNGYYGFSLGDDKFSQEERNKMIDLQKHCNKIIWR